MPQSKKEKCASPFVISDFRFQGLTQTFFLQQGFELNTTDLAGEVVPLALALQYGLFGSKGAADFPEVEVQLREKDLLISCLCQAPDGKLCGHGARVLLGMRNRREVRLFFDQELRGEEMRKVAVAYGLEGEQELDNFFEALYGGERQFEIRPKLEGLVPVQQYSASYVEEQLLKSPPKEDSLLRGLAQEKTNSGFSRFLVLGQHRFYHHLFIELMEGATTREGKLKNPLQSLAPQELVWQTESPEELKFYTAISRFQNNFATEPAPSDIAGLKALLKNPAGLPVYLHDAAASINITAGSIVPVHMKPLHPDLRVAVDQKGDFYEVKGHLVIDDKWHDLRQLRSRFGYFIQIGDTLYLPGDQAYLRVIDFFRQYQASMLIHHSKFEEFRQNILLKLEHKIRILYAYVRPASTEQLKEKGFDKPEERLIYLSDSDPYVHITPVMRYGEVEIPVLSQQQIYTLDAQGNPFTLDRNEAAELEFISALLLQHPHFKEQLHLDYFYLHKERFLDENWFPDAFEDWRNRGFQILGFSQISRNKLNPHKGKVSIIVTSGVDWFDTHVEVKFGNLKASLKHLHKALRNKSRFVQLDDGTQGILPGDWIQKLSRFFEAAEVKGEKLRTPKVNFTGIQELYEEEMLSGEVKQELALYREKLENFETIQEVPLPEGLTGTLRPYQQQGLNWLNFLDEFGFGGCLADDMGLGKTIQILAFILSQREKQAQNINLVVVPTTLIFNWQAEVAKFAPSIRLLTLHGQGRLKDLKEFVKYEIILTTYGTLLSDIGVLKRFPFNYIFLDESQAIKNPQSQRYKAARLLQSRNKIVLTGTPFENNTFDIYGQLSFACPGLLGTQRWFKGQYSDPVDKFKDSKRALELQRKIQPFILRRTKGQVAQELPEKTEMTIYCEMGGEQRKIYDAYAKEYYEYLTTKKEGDIDRNRLHVLQGLTKLRQICNSPALLNDQHFLGHSSAKIETLLEQIENKAPRHKILIFSQFTGMLDLIREELRLRHIPFEYLSGQSRNRKEKVDNFQKNENVRVFLISLKAGGTGLNLTAADYVYLVDPWWNPAVENQATDRVYRIGQNKNVVAVRLICPGTIEEKIMQLQVSKKELAGDLIRTDASLMKSLTKEELLELFV